MVQVAPKARSPLSRLDDAIGRAEAAVIGVAMLAMAVNTIANVIGRYVFAHSLYFSEELNEILMVAVTFVGLGYVTRRGRHIRMSALYDQLPERVRKLLMVIIALATGAMMFLLAWYAFEYVVKIAGRGRVTPAMQLPLWITYVAVVVGFTITGIQYVLTAIRNLDFSEPGVFVSRSELDAYEDPELATIVELYGRDHDLDDAAAAPEVPR